MYRYLLLPAMLMAISACASGDPGDGDRAGPPGGPPRIRLFISPSGEPFRGEGGLARWFAQADADHDGAITLEEFRIDAMRSFKVLDVNGDGTIDGFELQAYERDIVPEIGIMTFDDPAQGGGRMRRGGGGPGGSGGAGAGGATGGSSPRTNDTGGSHVDAEALLRQQSVKIPIAGRDGAARYSLLNEPQPIAAADADLDGKVTLAEWKAITDRRFAKLDRLKTGRLTMDSLLKVQPKDQKGGPRAAPNGQRTERGAHPQ